MISNPSDSRIARAEARKLGWSSTISTVLGHGAIVADRHGVGCGTVNCHSTRRSARTRRNPTLDPHGLRIARSASAEARVRCGNTPAHDHDRHHAHDRILAERARYVERRRLHAPARRLARRRRAVTDVDGRTFLDFAGGIGCQNTGHRFAPVVDAIKAQADDVPPPVLHGRRLRAVRRGLPAPRRALARARGSSRSRCSSTRAPRRTRTPSRSRVSATGRPAVVVFDNAFHGRTLLTMTMTPRSSPTRPASGRSRPRSTALRCRTRTAASRPTMRSPA